MYTHKLEKRIAELEAALNQHELGRPSSPLIENNAQSTASSNSSSSHQTAQKERTSFEGLKCDGMGTITFHGPTSFFQLPSHNPPDETLTQSSSSEDTAEARGDRRERLVANAWEQRVLETLAETPVNRKYRVIPRILVLTSYQQPFQHLLQSHWCWIQPLWNFVYRPAFTRKLSFT